MEGDIRKTVLGRAPCNQSDCRWARLYGRAVLRRGIYAISVKTQHSLGFEIVGVVHGLHVHNPSDGVFPVKRAAAEHGAPGQGYL